MALTVPLNVGAIRFIIINIFENRFSPDFRDGLEYPEHQVQLFLTQTSYRRNYRKGASIFITYAGVQAQEPPLECGLELGNLDRVKGFVYTGNQVLKRPRLARDHGSV